MLLYAPDGVQDAAPVRGRTRLQKMLFLLKQEENVDSIIPGFYHFEPYRFGPFEARIYSDVEFLENVGLVVSAQRGVATDADVSEAQYASDGSLLPGDTGDAIPTYSDTEFRLTTKGTGFVEAKRLWADAPPELRAGIERVKRMCNTAPLTAVLRYVYQHYPAYAEESELQWLRP